MLRGVRSKRRWELDAYAGKPAKYAGNGRLMPTMMITANHCLCGGYVVFIIARCT